MTPSVDQYASFSPKKQMASGDIIHAIEMLPRMHSKQSAQHGNGKPIRQTV
jgi:hypothetical protein